MGADETIHDGDLHLHLETPLPETLPTGAASAFFCFGSCFHRHQRVRSLDVLVGGTATPVTALGMPRLDLFRALHPDLLDDGAAGDADVASEEDPELRSYRSGFWGTIPIPPVGPPGSSLAVRARAHLDDGTDVEVELGRIAITGPMLEPRLGPTDVEGGLIAVCMATYNPDMDLFRVQVDSLRKQTDENWICLVGDDCSAPDRYREIEAELEGDTRFVLSRSERRLGFYRSFERALGMTPPDASLVALCDQDDRWYPEKLATLRAGLGTAQLVYSDQRLVSASGEVLAETYWTKRSNNHTNLISLLIANTITGAASLMRREVVERALPFPQVPAEQYHDHWLGLVAMTMGDVAYVDRALYDYVQHEGAALGHAAANAGIAGRGASRWRDNLTPAHWRHLLGQARPAYFLVYVRLEVLARVLLERAHGGIARRKRRALQRFVGAERSPLPAAWLALRMVRGWFGRSETLGVELLVIQGILWPPALSVRARGVTRPGSFNHDASLPRPASGNLTTGFRDPTTAHIQSIIEPLPLSVSVLEPARVNLLIPTIDLKHLFGGYIAKFNLARKLAESGRRVRIVTVDPTPPLPANWRAQVESYSGLQGALGQVEICFARDDGQPLPISPDDRFIATTWWTAHVARAAVEQTRSDRFVYLIQEYEPFTFEMGSLAALAVESYGFPHLAVFSTELLRDFFANHRYGVFAAGDEAGKSDSLSFQNAITPTVPPAVEDLAQRRTRRLLFYARSEQHARRNMFELGLLSISRAIEAGTFGPDWEFFGIGSVAGGGSIALPGGASIELRRRRGQSDYGELLGAHDVGLSLMFTPHPSLVPLEMASAGMLTVTNTFENKTATALSAISANLIAAEPTIEGVAEGLRQAVGRVDDPRSRVEGARVNWSRDWEDSFSEPVMKQIGEQLDRCAR